MADITQLLERATDGEVAARNQLMPLIYEQLRRIARRQLLDTPHQLTLATTALVHEAYIELFDGRELAWPDRGGFFAYAAAAMRGLLVDCARRRLADKRGGQATRVDIANIDTHNEDESLSLLALDQALSELAQHRPRWAKVVELRFFAGLSLQDTAAALGIDSRSVERDWQKARAFIHQSLNAHHHSS